MNPEKNGNCWRRAAEGVPLACQGVPELECRRAQERELSGIRGLAVQKKGKWFGEVGQVVALGAVITDADIMGMNVEGAQAAGEGGLVQGRVVA